MTQVWLIYSGAQPGDPGKAAAVILQVAFLDEPPLRLLLGSDCGSRRGAGRPGEDRIGSEMARCERLHRFSRGRVTRGRGASPLVPRQPVRTVYCKRSRLTRHSRNLLSTIAFPRCA